MINYLETDDLNNSIHEVTREAFDALYFQILIDKNGKVLYINEKYAEFFGLPKQEIIGKQVEEIIPNTRLYETLESGIPAFDEVFQYENGQQVVYSKVPIKNSYGEIQGLVTASSFNALRQIDELHNKIDELEESNMLLTKKLYGLDSAPAVFDAIVGHSPVINNLKKTLSKVCNSTMPILLTGESGTGKEVFATAIHNASYRKDKPFVKVNCAAIPKDLVESELFGYETGTFSGAIKGGKAGKFELANHGTILLDEVEELPLEAQSKLLRVLQEYEVERIGSVTPIPLDIHLICCSNQDLYQMVIDKKFREDLLYRINVMELEIAPLRERKEDIPDLCDSIIREINAKYKLKLKGISSDAISLLSEYDWPGNVRELAHVIERASVLCEKKKLSIEDFDFFRDMQARSLAHQQKYLNTQRRIENKQNFFDEKAEHEKHIIIDALEKAAGNKTKAAKSLGISRSLLYAKLNKYDIMT